MPILRPAALPGREQAILTPHLPHGSAARGVAQLTRRYWTRGVDALTIQLGPRGALGTGEMGGLRPSRFALWARGEIVDMSFALRNAHPYLALAPLPLADGLVRA